MAESSSPKRIIRVRASVPLPNPKKRKNQYRPWMTWEGTHEHHLYLQRYGMNCSMYHPYKRFDPTNTKWLHKYMRPHLE